MRFPSSRHRIPSLRITVATLALAATASSQLTPDQIKARETQGREALKNRHTVDEYGDFGVARSISTFPITELSRELKVKAGAVSLFPDLKDHGGERTAVYLLNATDKPLKNADSNFLRCFAEVKDGDHWRSCHDNSIDCGVGMMPPQDLAPGHGKLLLGWDPAVGDMTGELRYCVQLRDHRPVVSASFKGHYSSEQLNRASPPRGFAGKAIANGLDGKDWNSPEYISSDLTHSPEECLAAAELDRVYDESPLTKAALVRWKTTPVTGEEMARCHAVVEKLLRQPWKKNWLDAPALFRRGHAALIRPRGQAEFGSPENCRALVWRYLRSVPVYGVPINVNPARWEQLEAIRLSGNPWGVDHKLAAALLEEAIASLRSPDAAEREAAGSFLEGEWITPDYLPDERWSFIMEQDAASARISAFRALKRRGKIQQANKWLGYHLDLPPKELAWLWPASVEEEGKLAGWELAIALHLLETSPLDAASPLWQRRNKIEEAGGKLPAELCQPLRRFLAKEAEEKRLAGSPPPEPGVMGYADSQVCDLDSLLRLLAAWEDPADTPLIRSYLAHPAASYWEAPLTRDYTLRSTAAKLLKERNENVPEGIVFEELVK
ncbi:hypothetical protein [Luteolibacter soli]|uniref:Uncharacterized protein n=1 Tax=Luteolibacter soli TaxID=3135280 RepID=A0ABU9AZ81_9BACT